MSVGLEEPKAAEADLEQDTEIVEDVAQAEAEAEKKNAALIKKVEKIITGKVPDKKQAGGDDDSPAEDAEVAEDEEGLDKLSQSLKDRAKDAGISDDLANRLHQNGLLEESLAAMHRKIIDSFGQEIDSEEEPDQPPPRKKAVSKVPYEEEEVPTLNEEFDERLLKRDAYLQEQIADLKRLSQATMRQQDARFQSWFAKQVEGLKRSDLFGKDTVAKGSAEHKNLQKLCNGYERLCIAGRINPYDCDAESFKYAFPAQFRDEVFKAAQRETVKRLRDAEGKFVHGARSGGTVPSSKKRQTPEETEAALIKQVEGILNKKG